MSDQNSAIRQRLKEMAQLTVFSGRISEIQEKNLRHYPFVFFNELKSVKIDYDLTKPLADGQSVERHVTYHLEMDIDKNAMIEKRFFCLVEATQVLFWKDLIVRVYVNKQFAHTSESNGNKPTS